MKNKMSLIGKGTIKSLFRRIRITKENNFFSHLLDAGFYLILYIAIPITSAFTGWTEDRINAYIIMGVLSLSMLYDSITRYNKEQNSEKKRKIVTAGTIAAGLSIFTVIIMLVMQQYTISDAWLSVYLLVIIPFSIAACDIFQWLYIVSNGEKI